MIEAKRIVYASAFDGEPKLDNFRIDTEELPALGEGGKSNQSKADVARTQFMEISIRSDIFQMFWSKPFT